MQIKPNVLNDAPDLAWNHIQYNNYISEEYHFHFIATPKVACTALKWWFASLQHIDEKIRLAPSRETDPALIIHDALQIVAPDMVASSPERFDALLRRPEMWRFAFVRHPVARIFSAWASKILLAEPAQAHLLTDEFEITNLQNASDIADAFERFVTWLATHEFPKSWRDPHWAPQSLLLQPSKINYTGGIWQIEHLAHFNEAWQSHFSHTVPSIRLDRMNETPLSYSPEFISEQALQKLYKIYEDDFTLFRYTKQPPPGKNHDTSLISSQLREVTRIRGRNKRFGQILKQLDEGGSRITHLTQELEQACTKLVEATRQNSALIAHQRQLERDLKTMSDERAELHQQLSALYASRSWRMTKPLRILSNTLRPSTWIGPALRKAYEKEAVRRAYFHLRWHAEHILPPRVYSALIFHAKRMAFVPKASDSATRGTWLTFYTTASVDSADQPLVSVIVPNYNHASYLQRRLDSIYTQSYKNFEVILLDDASTDHSLSILQDYAKRYPDRTRLFKNEQNSGSPFKQWRKGLAAARGALIWIAESDDECDADFLESLLPQFSNPAVRLAFCQTLFINQEGLSIWSTKEYLHQFGTTLWDSDFVASAAQLVERVWLSRNIIANVSSAVFRRPASLHALDFEDWDTLKVCGDWMFYLHIIRGGLVAYNQKLLNRYRVHTGNTSVRLHQDVRFYVEHSKIYAFACRHYALSETAKQSHKSSLREHWQAANHKGDFAQITQIYAQIDEMLKATPKSLNILICGFSLTSGGGEVFPVILANGLHALDVNVSFFNFARLPTNPAIRQRLHPDIPLFELDDLSRFARLIEDLRIDVVHSHHAWADVALAHLMQDTRDCALVVTTHGMYETLSAGEQHRVRTELRDRVDQFVYIAEKNLEPFDQNFILDKHFVRISNAVEQTPITIIDRAKMGISPDALVICLVSRAIPEKGWQEAIEALVMARENSGSDIHLLLVGDGPEYDRLARGSTPHGVHLLGFRDDVQNLFHFADLGILPSRFSGESYPLVALECLAAGRPFAATAVGEIPRLLHTPAGLAGWLIELVDGQIDISRWAELFALLARDRSLLELKATAVDFARSAHDLAGVAQAYLQVYHHALGLRRL